MSQPLVFHVAVLDTETTGLSAATDRLIEVAVKLLQVDADARLLGEIDVYHSLHDPGMRIPYGATAVHGITNAMVKGHRIDAPRLVDILARADLVVAHNSGFDKGFVRQVVPHADDLLWGCSCRGIPWKRLYPRLWSISLPELARTLGVRTGQAHRALGDVETTVELLLQADPSGTTHLKHLVAKKLAKRLPRVAKATAAPAPAEPVESPAQFVLRVLGQFPDNECSIADLHGWQDGRPSHGYAELTATVADLQRAGRLRVSVDTDRTLHWSLA